MELKTNCVEHHAFLLNYLTSTYEKEEYLDVAFVCKGGKVVKAHQLVLASVSPFLRALFNESKTADVCISLSEVDDRVLTLLLTLMYEGTLKLLASDVQEFQELIEMLGIKFPGEVYITYNIHLSSVSAPQNGIDEISSSPMAVLAVDSTVDYTEGPAGLGDPHDDPLNIPDRYFVTSKGVGSGPLNGTAIHPKQDPADDVNHTLVKHAPLTRRSTESRASQTGASVHGRQTSATNEESYPGTSNEPGHDLSKSSVSGRVTRTTRSDAGAHKRKRNAENTGEILTRKKTRSKDKESNKT